MREREMADKRDIAKACRTFTNEVAKARAAKHAVHPAVVERFVEKLGGADGYADVLVEDFRRSRGEGLSEEEEDGFEIREQVVQRYHQMLLGSLQKNDEFAVGTSPFEGLDPEDLKAELVELALHHVRHDPEIRAAVFDAIKADDALFRDLIGATDVLEVAHES